MTRENRILQLEATMGSCSVETHYENAKHDMGSVYADEKERRSRLHQLLLEHEKEELQVEVSAGSIRVQELTTSIWELESTLEDSRIQHRRVLNEVRTKTREIESLKAEISTLQGIAADSTKMLTDKLTLAHEIASMKPELDHLRCQVMSHQGVLSEKLSLQRQLNTLQIELENEKRAAKRVADREQDASNGKHLKTRLAETQADLAREKRDKQKLEREAQRTSTETENRIFALSSRLDTLRSKLHASEEQLKAKQSETIPPRSQKAESSNGDSRTTKKNPSKGRAAKADESTVIGTPGQSLAEARTKRKTAVVGEKSFFSTTPYLNRAASVAPSSPALSSDQSEHKNTGCGRNQEGSTDEHEEEHMSAKERQPAEVKHGHFLAIGKNRPHGENTIPKTNFGLTQIIEEGDDQAKKNCQPLRRASEEQLTSDIAPKKRRLLTGGMGSTLFDEEESGNVIKRTKLGGNIRLGGSRRVGPIGGRTSTQASAGGLFGAISPLKKNRKILVA